MVDVVLKEGETKLDDVAWLAEAWLEMLVTADELERETGVEDEDEDGDVHVVCDDPIVVRTEEETTLA